MLSLKKCKNNIYYVNNSVPMYSQSFLHEMSQQSERHSCSDRDCEVATLVTSTSTATKCEEDEESSVVAQKQWLYERDTQVNIVGSTFHRQLEGQQLQNTRPLFDPNDKVYTLDKTPLVGQVFTLCI